MQDDRRDCDRRLGGKPILDRLQHRIARRLIIAVAIGLDHDLDKIRVVKGEPAAAVPAVVGIVVAELAV